MNVIHNIYGLQEVELLRLQKQEIDQQLRVVSGGAGSYPPPRGAAPTRARRSRPPPHRYPPGNYCVLRPHTQEIDQHVVSILVVMPLPLN